MGEAVVDPGSFLHQFAKRWGVQHHNWNVDFLSSITTRYDSYWQRRRGGRARERAQYRAEEEGEGILLPEDEGAEQVKF